VTHPGRLQIGTVAAFKSEYPAGFIGIHTYAKNRVNADLYRHPRYRWQAPRVL
jgi:hypothetical protein